MQEIKFNGNSLKLYDSIDELPITRFQAYSRYCLIDAGIGSDLTDFDKQIGVLLRYIGQDKKEEATKVVMNMRQTLHFLFEKISPETNAFFCLVKEINGRAFDDVSEESIQTTIKALSKKGLTIGKVRYFLNAVKKKLTRNLRFFFLKRTTAAR